MDLSLLKNVTLFEGLNHPQIQKIADIAAAQSYEGSAHIFREGDPGDAMYVVAEGKVRISKMVPGIGEEALSILEKGAYFGEMALIEDGPRSADAIAHIPCKLVMIRRDKLDQLLFTDKDLAYVLLWTFVRTLTVRLRETNEKIKAFFAMTRF
jgi:CRP/FNR family cyclic AMP-dependent transcriptional regulator